MLGDRNLFQRECFYISIKGYIFSDKHNKIRNLLLRKQIVNFDYILTLKTFTLHLNSNSIFKDCPCEWFIPFQTWYILCYISCKMLYLLSPITNCIIPWVQDWLPTNHVKCSEPLSLSPHSHEMEFFHQFPISKGKCEKNLATDQNLALWQSHGEKNERTVILLTSASQNTHPLTCSSLVNGHSWRQPNSNCMWLNGIER